MSYKYNNRRLQPRMCEDLILELLDGKELERKEIIRIIPQEHIARGGKETNADITGVIKKALANLKKKGKAENEFGYWTIKNTNIESPSLNKTRLEELSTPTPPKDDFEPIIEVGEGRGAVYLYYYPNYKSSALNNKKKKWHCKIGKSDNNAGKRIQGQGATSQPEKPVFAVNYRTNNPADLEKAIHSILTYRKQKIESSGGSEWFMTNPEEFLGLTYFLNQGLN